MMPAYKKTKYEKRGTASYLCSIMPYKPCVYLLLLGCWLQWQGAAFGLEAR